MITRKKAAVLVVCVALAVAMVSVGVTLNWALLYMQDHEIVVGEGDYQLLDEIKGMFASYGLYHPTEEELLDGAARGMVAASGDKYAYYFTGEEYAAFVEEQSGNYVGIGVTTQMDTEKGHLIISEIAADSPAAETNIRYGDQIIGVDGVDTEFMPLEELVALVRGEEGTEVTLIVRHDDGQEETVELTRRPLTQNFVTSKMAADRIGYVKIEQFAGNADVQFIKQVKELVKQGAKALVLDLRNNPGGDKDIVCAIADTLFPAGPILIRENSEGYRQVDYSDTTCLGLPMVVLGNENSASASELLIGGIQDYKVGVLLGTQTFGKGIVQSFIPMPDGSSVMKLTTDRYLTPLERSIHEVGCTPDIVLEPCEDILKNPLLMATERDNQYMKALEILAEKLK